MHPILATALADEHRRDLLARAEHARLMRAARSAAKPRTARRRLVVPRTRFRPVYALHAWIASVSRGGSQA